MVFYNFLLLISYFVWFKIHRNRIPDFLGMAKDVGAVRLVSNIFESRVVDWRFPKVRLESGPRGSDAGVNVYDPPDAEDASF